MARPKSKESLITLSQENYNKLISYVNNLDDAQKSKGFSSSYLNRNIRDVLAHLHHWHLMMIDWYTVGMSGDTPQMPAKGYTWRSVPALNREINMMYQQKPLKEVCRDLQISFDRLQQIIDSHSNEELFTNKKYHWTGSTSLAAYLISATSSHYDWGLKLIKKGLLTKK